MSASPGTSRAERQAARDAANAAAYVSFTQAANQPGGGVNQPKYQTRGGPTWADTPAGRALRAEYERSGVVFDSGGNIIYNPTDLGAENVEAARAAQGLPPSYKTKGSPSGQYLAAVSQVGGDINKIKTKQRELDAVRSETMAEIASAKASVEQNKAALAAAFAREYDSGQKFHDTNNLSLGIARTTEYISELQGRLKTIDSARSEVAKEQRMAQTYQTKAAFEATRKKATEGPRPIQNALAADYTQKLEASRPKPQRERPQAVTGIKEKLYTNPTFIQDAESFTRAPSFQGETRKERPKAQQGITDKLFLNPDYVTKEQQRKTDQENKISGVTNWTVSLTENITNRETTIDTGIQSFINNLKGEGFTQIELKGKSKTKIVNIDQALSEISKSRERVEISVSGRDPKIKAQNQTNIENKEKLKTFINEAQAAGFGLISIKSPTQNKTVPIKDAFREILKTKDVTGIGAVPILPKDTILAGSIAQPTLLTTEQRQKIEAKPKSGDPIGEALYNLERMKTTNPIYQAGRVIDLNVLGAVASFANYMENVDRRLYGKDYAKPEDQIFIPSKLTPSSELLGGFIGSSVEAVEKRNAKYFFGGLAKASESAYNMTQSPSYGVPGFAADVVVSTFPYSPVKSAVAAQRGFAAELTVIPKILSLQYEKVAIPGVSATAKTFSAKFGGTTRELISLTSEGNLQRGAPKFYNEIIVTPTTAKQIKRGVKLAADSTRLEQKVFTDIETLSKIKDITPEALERARNINRIIELGSESKDTAKRGYGSQPFAAITEQETPSLLGTFKKQQRRVTDKIGAIEGSASQIPYMLEGYLRQAKDFDFHLEKFSTAKARAIQTAKEIKPSEGRQFLPDINEKTKTAHVELIEAGKKDKVGEFLNAEEIDESGELQSIEGDTLFGRKIPEGAEKIEGLKTYGLQRQFLKKGESIFSLQKTPEGKFTLEPFDPRKVKDVSDFYGISDTKAVNLLLAGKTKQALELGRELSQFQKNFSEIDIASFFKRGEPAETTSIKETPSILDQIIASPDAANAAAATATKTPLLEQQETPRSIGKQLRDSLTTISAAKPMPNISAVMSQTNQRRSITSTPSKMSRSTPSVSDVWSKSPSVASASLGSKMSSLASIVGGSRSNGSLFSQSTPSFSVSSKSTGSKSTPSKSAPSGGSSAGSPASVPSVGGNYAHTKSITGKSPSVLSLITEDIPTTKQPPARRLKLPDFKRATLDRRNKSKGPKPTDFLGNASQENISTGYNRQEIFLGIKRTAKKEKKDLSFGKKQRSQLLRSIRL